jgi:hypothetical protein
MCSTHDNMFSNPSRKCLHHHDGIILLYIACLPSALRGSKLRILSSLCIAPLSTFEPERVVLRNSKDLSESFFFVIWHYLWYLFFVSGLESYLLTERESLFFT